MDPGIQIGRSGKAFPEVSGAAAGAPLLFGERRGVSEKLTIRAPPPARARGGDRESQAAFIGRSHGWPGDASAVSISRLARCTARQDAHMGAATTEIGLHFRRGSARRSAWKLRLQQGLRPHHHAGDAIAALGRACSSMKAPLDRRRRLDGAEPLSSRRHLLALEQQQRRHARTTPLCRRRSTVQAPALTEAAAETWRH